VQERIRAASLDQLDRLAEKILFSAGLDEVFDD
jgi:hypothetical protein